MVSAVDQAYDEKNIRRRVYDALNVLMAMDIITKEKKNIMWRGLPTNTEQEGARLQACGERRGMPAASDGVRRTKRPCHKRGAQAAREPLLGGVGCCVS
eukprot:7037712-Prymnesium_polylepis.1